MRDIVANALKSMPHHGSGKTPAVPKDAIAYDRILVEANRLASEGDYLKASKRFQKAIKSAPQRPEAYHQLGHAHLQSGDLVRAVEMFIRAIERGTPDSKAWATSVALVFVNLSQCMGGGAAARQTPGLSAISGRMRDAIARIGKPDWWHPAGLREMSARAVRLVPEDVLVWVMRAHVLSRIHSLETASNPHGSDMIPAPRTGRPAGGCYVLQKGGIGSAQSAVVT